MDVIKITGGKRLNGTIAASGSKNAALPIMAASILADGPVTLSGVPDLADVNTLALLLGHLGVETKRDLAGALKISTVDSRPTRAASDLVSQMRASFCVLGPLLARRGRAIVALPGGCAIGTRPVDLHLKGLAALGADIRIEQGYVVARATRLHGAKMSLAGPRGPTVTGTANVMAAATIARGHSTILGAACEPEIADLGQFLIAMGAKIDGLGTATIEIDGVEQLDGAAHRVIPDRIEAATLLIAAAITRGSIEVTGVIPGQMSAVLTALDAAGAELQIGPNRIGIALNDRPRPFRASAAPYPGVPTDVQAQLTALASVGTDTSYVRDQVFPLRFQHIGELNRLGAAIDRRGNCAIVTGVQSLCGGQVTASDLRASAAFVLAGLAARGTTVVHGIEHLDRGYERFEAKLNSLGARIERVTLGNAAEKAARRADLSPLAA
jgi:UDP-N-acetylglucosamine 1-carboxyvinyltransferase